MPQGSVAVTVAFSQTPANNRLASLTVTRGTLVLPFDGEAAAHRTEIPHIFEPDPMFSIRAFPENLLAVVTVAGPNITRESIALAEEEQPYTVTVDLPEDFLRRQCSIRGELRARPHA
jgi:hypothetical protein